jgi:hypothetical protein
MNDNFSTPLNQLMNQPPSYAEILATENKQQNSLVPSQHPPPLGPDLRPPPSVMPSASAMEPTMPMMNDSADSFGLNFPQQENISSNRIPSVDTMSNIGKQEKEPSKGSLFDEMFNPNTQYELLYIIGAGVIMNSEAVQTMIRNYWPSLFDGTKLTMSGILIQAAIIGILFVVIRHLSSVKK